MNFCISGKQINNGQLKFVFEEAVLPGIRRISELVASDIEKVVGQKPDIMSTASVELKQCAGKIIVCTYGNSAFFDTRASQGDLDLTSIAGKRECYVFKLLETDNENHSAPALLIAGSDKRGTIYGLFHLSELLGVSPLVNWNRVYPAKRKELVINDTDRCISKEPSVKYRGFFINDEWPAFGNWCNEHFGGFTADCYSQVFELLLRLKGNYLWPAMWSAVFSEDGPGLENARLADEMGVIMGMSHHEPCLRNGEEYSHVRGKNSIYGDAWNFRTNEAGITRFWEDGLKRNGRFENVITVGMRGEADSTIMGKDATLKDNIDLLRDVLKCQNSLIRTNINADLDQVPRMLALYKEVEPFYYGDENTEGLMTSPELEGVTLMLCDDNFGNLRTIPNLEMRNHKGGFGMYYHFDYHGWPVSYEWINSTYLPKVWDQMTYAYEAGIRELWIVNVGDIFTNEYPLSFFLDLAYDYDKWGINNKNAAVEYTAEWAKNQFGAYESTENVKLISDLLLRYTRIASKRRPEAMNLDMYDKVKGWNEACMDDVICTSLMEKCKQLKEQMSDDSAFPYFQFVYYPLMGVLNVRKLWACTYLNNYYAKIGADLALDYARKARESLDFDSQLIQSLHTMEGGRWFGMGLSEHIGFANWNEEECRYPVLYDFRPSNKKRIIALNPGTGIHTEGGDWTKKTITVNIANSDEELFLLTAGNEKVEVKITNVEGNIEVSALHNEVIPGEYCWINIYETATEENNHEVEASEQRMLGRFIIESQTGAHIPVEVYKQNVESRIIPAENYSSLCNIDGAGFELVGTEGNILGIKAFPVDKSFEPGKGPSVTYSFSVAEAGEYAVDICMLPGNPPFMDNRLMLGFAASDGTNRQISAVLPDFRVGDFQAGWMRGVLDNARINRQIIHCNAGENSFTITAITPNVNYMNFAVNSIV